jgi:hypothetical protein
MEEDNIYSEAKPPGPKFIRVFDIGKSKESFAKACCQTVGLITSASPLPRVCWMTRPKPKSWFWSKPKEDENCPFILRIVEPNYAGILLHLIENGEVQVLRSGKPLEFRFMKAR